MRLAVKAPNISTYLRYLTYCLLKSQVSYNNTSVSMKYERAVLR